MKLSWQVGLCFWIAYISSQLLFILGVILLLVVIGHFVVKYW